MARRKREEAGTLERDHVRDAVARTAARIIAERGLEGAKVREVCAELGYSTHIVSHYFESKKEMLLFTLRQCAARQVTRLKDAIARGDSPIECLESLMPLDPERLIDARMWVVFWAQTSDPEIAAVQQDFGARWRRLLIGMMRMRGYFTPGMPRARQDFVAQRLQTAVAGIGIHGALGVWQPEVQRRHLEAELGWVLESFAREDAAASSQHQSHASVANRDLVIENARLRNMLVDAMLRIETLKEAQVLPSLDRLPRARKGATA